MSNAEIAPESSPEFSFTYPAMVAGVIANVALIPNFLGSVSRIVGCVRVTAGGTPGTVTSGLSLSPSPLTAGGFTVVSLCSSDALDTSVYRLFWTNQVAQSQLATVLSC
jgi:hypothetical protein